MSDTPQNTSEQPSESLPQKESVVGAPDDTANDAVSDAVSGAASAGADDTSSFATRYRPQLREAFVAIVRDAVAAGADPTEQARAYAERGKPDFVLAYLLVSPVSDDEKRDLYALAHERRAIAIEQRAKEFDRSFHRPFPLLSTEAAKDRALARRIRAGLSTSPNAGRQLPMR